MATKIYTIIGKYDRVGFLSSYNEEKMKEEAERLFGESGNYTIVESWLVEEFVEFNQREEGDVE